MIRTHVDLFTGLGGFALAAQANDVQTVAMCEIEPHCRAFLSKAWPEVELHDDVRTFDGQRYAGATWLLTGGVPCQPASRAGKQRGSEDSRWLWPQAIRCLSEIRPAWAIFENPPGIRDVAEYGVQPPVDADDAAIGNIGDVFNRTGLAHIHQILEAIEAQGYAVQVYSLPAASVNAPHLRERYWIVCRMADARQQHGERRQTKQHTGQDIPGEWYETADNAQRASRVADAGRLGSGQDEPRRGSDRRAADRRDRARLGDADTSRWPGRAGQQRARWRRESAHNAWDNAVYVPCADNKFRRAPDDSFDVADGLHRSLLAALGNSIVPEVARRIIAAMIEAEQEEIACSR